MFIFTGKHDKENDFAFALFLSPSSESKPFIPVD